jgi:hypothetical protein
MILMAPAAASQLIFASVGIEHMIQVAMAATATNNAVHVAWLVTALSPIETLRMAEPVTKIQSKDPSVSAIARDRLHMIWKLTQHENPRKHIPPNPAEHDTAGSVNAINLGMAQLEAANDIVGLRDRGTAVSGLSSTSYSGGSMVTYPSRDASYYHERDDARDKPKDGECFWDGKNANTDLSFDHEY